jgi:predicted N-acetyltransferase YhbS
MLATAAFDNYADCPERRAWIQISHVKPDATGVPSGAGHRKESAHSGCRCSAAGCYHQGRDCDDDRQGEPDPMDMLVKLYDLPHSGAALERMDEQGIHIRRALAPEKHKIAAWVRENFGEGWASEAEIGFARQPISCFIAVKEGRIVGFACHDATCRNFFGPTGVAPEVRKGGVGTALLFACLEAMRQQGFGYAIIGGAGPTAYYAKAVGAVPIEGSEPGVYRGLLDSRRFERN